MPDQTRDALKRLAESMRRANGAEATPASASAGNAAPPAAAPGARPGRSSPSQKAKPAPSPARPARGACRAGRALAALTPAAQGDHAPEPHRQHLDQPGGVRRLAVGGGLGTAWYMVEAGSRLSTRSFGPWTTWTAAGRPDADPYTRAHTARNALLPLVSTLELTYGPRPTAAAGGCIRPASTPSSWRASTAPGGASPPSTARAG